MRAVIGRLLRLIKAALPPRGVNRSIEPATYLLSCVAGSILGVRTGSNHVGHRRLVWTVAAVGAS